MNHLVQERFINTNAFIVFTFCHPELVSGSHIALVLDAETSSA
jgi:hypothetical protein